MEKIKEITSNIWLKLLGAIPICFLRIDDKEAIMIATLMFIMTIDVFFGAAVAQWIRRDFNWGLLGKKICKKFLLYFFTLLASFVIARAYTSDGFGWFFYTLGTILVFSEFGSLMEKAQLLGFPVKIEYIGLLNSRIDGIIRKILKK